MLTKLSILIALGASCAQGAAFTEIKTQILDRRCVVCHGGDKPKHNVNLETYEKVMASAPHGNPIVVAEDPEHSALYLEPKGGSMPPRGTKLTDAEVQMLYDWIKAGAKND